jgi:hypothetical protein
MYHLVEVADLLERVLEAVCRLVDRTGAVTAILIFGMLLAFCAYLVRRTDELAHGILRTINHLICVLKYSGGAAGETPRFKRAGLCGVADYRLHTARMAARGRGALRRYIRYRPSCRNG